MLQNGSHQDNGLPFLNDSQPTNLGETSCTINSFDQPLVLGYHHSHASVCCDECPRTSCDLLFSHLHSNLDLECAPVKENIHIETSFAPHFPVCPTIQIASTCNRDTTCSLAPSYDELSPWSTQGSEVVHDKNSLNVQDSSHLSSSCVFHEDNLSCQLAKTENFDEACDKYRCHPKRSFEISNNIDPQAMHDLVHISKWKFSILETSGTCQGVEALHCLLMVMSGPCDSGKLLKPNKISFLMHNLSICMVALDMDPSVKNICYCGCDISKFQIFTDDWIHESLIACPSSCTSLTSKSGWVGLCLMQLWNFEIDHPKDYLCLDSYLSDVLSRD